MPTEYLFPDVTSSTLTARRIVRHWDERSYDELPGGPTLKRARVYNTLSGDLDGESWEEYLLTCHDDDSRSFVSVERFVGSVDGRVGSFVTQGIGTYENGVTRISLTIVPGSGTGELTDLRGEGESVTSGEEYVTLTLTCR